MHDKTCKILQRSIDPYVCEHVKHLKPPCEIWQELELVCSKYKHKKLSDELWYIIHWGPWEKVEDLKHRVHEDIESIPEEGVLIPVDKTKNIRKKRHLIPIIKKTPKK